eukprot:scaffold2929_cov343-Prasinococcus_capsulatus_cf.AAC.3
MNIMVCLRELAAVVARSSPLQALARSATAARLLPATMPARPGAEPAARGSVVRGWGAIREYSRTLPFRICERHATCRNCSRRRRSLQSDRRSRAFVGIARWVS